MRVLIKFSNKLKITPRCNRVIGLARKFWMSDEAGGKVDILYCALDAKIAILVDSFVFPYHLTILLIHF